MMLCKSPCCSPIHRRPHRSGFTLVELLVVIGIIALLISIVIPTIGRARDMGTRVGCANNLRQIMLAVKTYSMDWEGYIPYAENHGSSGASPWTGAGWLYQAARLSTIADFKQDQVKYGVLWKYLNTYDVYHCPADTPPYLGGTTRNTHQMASYMMNDAASGNGAAVTSQAPSLRLGRMQTDGIAFWEADETRGGDMWDDETNRPNNGLTARHGKGATLIRFDGATVWMTRAEFDDRAASAGRNELWCNPLKANGHP